MEPAVEPQPAPLAAEPQPVALVSNKDSIAVQTPVQPLEKRGDALLFEIDALQNTPFDEAVVMPFD